MKTSRRSLVIAISIALLSPCAFAGTRMIFPRIIFNQGRWSGIAIVNPNSADATITIKAYNPDGTPFAGDKVTNPATGAIPAGGQYLQLANQIFTPSDAITGSATPIRLWMEVTSPSDGLTGFFLEGNDSITSLYGGDLGTFGTDLYLPAVQNSGSSVTEISIVNPDTSDANLSVDFLRADGTKVDTRNVLVPKGGAIQGPLASVANFNLAYDQVVALRIHSDRPVVCYGVVYRQSDNTPTALSAQDSTVPAKTLYFPQLADGAGWSTGIGIVNLDFANDTLVTLTAYKEDGTLFADPSMTNPVTQLISKGGFFHATVRTLFGFSGQALQTGWIKVEANTPAINGYVEYGAAGSHALVTAQLISAQFSMFSHQANSSPYYTGLAVLNPNSLTTNVEVFSLNSNGDIVGKTQHVLRPGHKDSLTMQQWIPTSDGKTGGSVYVRTDQPVIATQLFGSAQALANVPPQQVTANYDPRGDPGKIAPVPPLAVVETGKSQQFVAGVTGIDWLVNGVKGGSDTIGTVTAGGLYKAPAKAPVPHTLTIEASTSSGDRSGGSSIDVVQRETLTGALTLVTSVAYLNNLNRFFLAEQQILSGSATLRYNAATANTEIYEVLPNGTTNPFLSIPGDTVAKMLPFVDNGTSYLILAGHDSGTIYRLDVASQKLATIISGLNQPDSLALDPITGNLLVAEAGAGQITVVPRSQILSAAAVTGALQASIGSVFTYSVPGVQGIAVDDCSGTVYATVADGTLHEYQGPSDRVVVSGLDHPGQLLALYRTGLSCADALSLAVVEASRISLVYPKAQLPRTSLIENLPNPVSDITFLPPGNPFIAGGEASVALAEPSSTPGQGQIADIRVGGLYQSVPPVAIPSSGLFASTGPNEDPVGDTFDLGLAAQQGYSVPDIVSVTGSVQGGSSVITIKFAGPVTLGTVNPTTGAPSGDALWAFIFLKTTSGTQYLSQFPVEVNFPSYFPFGDPGIFSFDSFLAVFAGETLYTSVTGQTSVVEASAIGNTLTLSVPTSVLNLSGALALVLVGNPIEFTDVAPNNGLLQLSP